MCKFGERLKTTRIENGMERNAFAKEIGCNISTLCRYENGKMVPKFNVACEIAERLKISLDYLGGLD